MRVLPFRPIQAGYSIQPDDGILAIKLDGGASRTSVVTQGNVGVVSVNWALSPAEYSLLAGFHRIWKRSLEPFLIDLVLDAAESDRYEAMFVPNTFALTGKSGSVHMVSAQLEVVPLEFFDDPATDPGEALVMLNEEYGRAAPLVINDLEKLVNEDLPNG
ncbi:hypothetical protein RBI14_15600 [Alcaligenaceae bacterium B3P038]|nr:hypothetical protein [Alcaligenaceae bacterium B3P038]